MKYCTKAQTVEPGNINVSGNVWAELGRAGEKIKVARSPLPPTTLQGFFGTMLKTTVLAYGLSVSIETINLGTFFPQSPTSQ